jgi:ferrous iron transport protein B
MPFTIGLCGNPNAGKTTLFNALTGSRQYVGNWPGVTVEKKQGSVKGHPDWVLVDLPGIYSLAPYTTEEVVTRNYLLEDTPDVLINIVDASNLERNLYLTSQLAELGLPMVVALNMMDLVEKRQDRLDAERLAAELGLPVIEIVALREQGGEELLQAAKAAHDQNLSPKRQLEFSQDIEDLLLKLEQAYDTLPLRVKNPRIAKRWYAIKALERDEDLLDAPLPPELESAICELEQAAGDDSQTLVSAGRYQHLEQVAASVYQTNPEAGDSLTERLDRVFMHKWLAIPIFVLIIFGVYYLAVSTLGSFLTNWTQEVVVKEWIQAPTMGWLSSIGTSPWLVDLVGNGIIAGVGAVLGFLPQMALLFILLGFLEETGYMARIAVILDRVFRHFGLSGKSFIPILVGTGCSVPGILASRTIDRESDRRMTIITTSFIPCGAKLPIIALIASTVMGGAWWVGPAAYFLGILAVLFSGLVLKKTRAFASDPAPFVMELPEYRLPTPKNLLRSVGERLWDFVRKAGTIILLSSMLIWFLQSYGWNGGLVAAADPSHSFLAVIGGLIAWLFIPLGFGSWQAAVATLTGLAAKENIVSTFGILYGVQNEALELLDAGEVGALSPIASHFTPLSGLSFLAFNLLCIPCFAAVGAMRRELGSAKWTLFGVAYQSFLAYSFCLIFYQVGLLIQGQPFTGASLAAFLVLAFWLYLVLRKPSQPKSQLEF